MTTRRVYKTFDSYPFVINQLTDCNWRPRSTITKKKNAVQLLHDTYKQQNKNCRLLEISTISENELGRQICAEILTKFVPSLDQRVPIADMFSDPKAIGKENIHPKQVPSSLLWTHDVCKGLNRETLPVFKFEGLYYPSKPLFLFFDYIYFSALLENEPLSDLVMEYDAFTDINENHTHCISPARSAAKFVSLCKHGYKNDLKDFDFLFNLWKKTNSAESDLIQKKSA